MILFVGGPYHGRELPFAPPFPKVIRLPRDDELEAFLNESNSDPGATMKGDWPFVYELDESVKPSFFRFVEDE